jgi:hypothetical protein
MKKKLLGLLGVLGVIGVVTTGVVAPVYAADEPATENNCTSILDPAWCNDESGEGAGIWGIINLVITIMTYLVGILATISIIIAGIQYTTGGDSPAQLAAAKNRILQTVIGLIIYAVMWMVLQWLLPGGIWNGTGGGA